MPVPAVRDDGLNNVAAALVSLVCNESEISVRGVRRLCAGAQRLRAKKCSSHPPYLYEGEESILRSVSSTTYKTSEIGSTRVGARNLINTVLIAF